MAEITATTEAKGNTILHSFDAIGNLDTGQEVLGFDYSDITIQIDVITLGVGGSIQLEGSNDGVNWHILNDPFDNALVFVADGMDQVLEACKLYRLHCTAGDGTTDINAFLFMRRQR